MDCRLPLPGCNHPRRSSAQADLAGTSNQIDLRLREILPRHQWAKGCPRIEPGGAGAGAQGGAQWRQGLPECSLCMLARSVRGLSSQRIVPGGRQAMSARSAPQGSGGDLSEQGLKRGWADCCRGDFKAILVRMEINLRSPWLVVAEIDAVGPGRVMIGVDTWITARAREYRQRVMQGTDRTDAEDTVSRPGGGFCGIHIV